MRSVAVLGFLVAVVTCTSGCTPSTTTDPDPTSSPTESSVGELTFDDGDLLDPAQSASWADPLATTQSYSVLTSDDGDGSWSYTSEETACVIGYWHGALTASGSASGDQELSDELLGVQFGATADEVEAFVEDGVGRFRTPSQLVETRAVAGADADAGTTYIVAARAFAALGEGFVATLRCPEAVNVVGEWATLSSAVGAFDLVFTADG